MRGSDDVSPADAAAAAAAAVVVVDALRCSALVSLSSAAHGDGKSSGSGCR